MVRHFGIMINIKDPSNDNYGLTLTLTYFVKQNEKVNVFEFIICKNKKTANEVKCPYFYTSCYILVNLEQYLSK